MTQRTFKNVVVEIVKVRTKSKAVSKTITYFFPTSFFYEPSTKRVYKIEEQVDPLSQYIPRTKRS